MIPRNEVTARAKLLADCKRPAFARLARYTKPTDDGSGESITRASVKFVETALARWGNVRTNSEISSDTKEARTVRVVVTDTEGGAEYSKEILLEKIAERKTVAAREAILGTRETAAGQVLLVAATEDDLAAKEAVLASIVIRQLGLRILPADLVAECMDVVAETLGELHQAPAIAATDPKAWGVFGNGAQVHPQESQPESRSTALAGLLQRRKASTPAKTPAAPQAGTEARQTVPCASCARPIYQSGRQWYHTNGARKCGEGRSIAKPKGGQQ